MTIRNITLHWTAGNHKQTFPGYHFCIQGDGTVVPSLALSKKGEHTWGRNTGNVGISLCAMAKGFPVTPIHIERAAKLCAELCFRHGLDPKGHLDLPRMKVVGNTIVPVPGQTIKAPVITDHAFYARADGYFPARWDIGEYLDPIVRKACWYYEKLVTKRILPEFIK